MFNHKWQGYSLMEVMITLLVFSLWIAVVSPQISRSLGGIRNAEKHMAEIYHAGL